MMKEKFIDRKFNSTAMQLLATINGILDEYEQSGYDLSLRQLYYQLVSRNVVPNTEKSYKNIGCLVSDARLAGMIDWEIIKDRGRNMVANPHWKDPAEIVMMAAKSFRIDVWKDQPCYIEVMVEKQALEGVLEPVCREMDVPFTANKGYSSSSAMYEASKRFLQRAQNGKELYVLYLGDHDPSGIDMTRDVLDRLKLFTDQEMTVKRLALNMDQVEELNPPENPAKVTDSRAASYISRFGSSSWELDAIEPRMLASLVKDAISGLIDFVLWRKSQKVQESMRKELLKFANEYNK